MKPKTLVIGAGGRVGRLLRGVWHGRADVAWLSRSGPGPGWQLSDGAAALAARLGGVDAILCLAGATQGGDLSLNARIAQTVLDAAAQARGVRLVLLASSASVYGAGAGPFREDDPCRPVDAYGTAKLEMEESARARSHGPMAVTALRLGNVVGADSLAPAFTAGRHVTLDRFPDGSTPRRSCIDPEALGWLVDGLARVARRGGALPRVLNAACRPPVEMAALLHALGGPFDYRDAPPGARPLVALDTGRLAALVPALAAERDAGALVAGWRRAAGAVA